MRFPPHLTPSAFDAALQRLRDGRPGESGYGRRIALVLTIPTFDDPVARDVRRATSGELYVVRTVWNRALDSAARELRREARIRAVDRMLGAVGLPILPSPSLVSTQLPVDAYVFQQLLDDVAAATLPCRPRQAEPPLDATFIEVTFGDALSEARYRWHGDGPEAWAPLTRFASRIIRLIDHPATAGVR